MHGTRVRLGYAQSARRRLLLFAYCEGHYKGRMPQQQLGCEQAENRCSSLRSVPDEPIPIMTKLSTPRDLLVYELQDLHSAETQLVKALPKMASAATNEELSEAFNEHLRQTQEHVARLENIGEKLGTPLKGKKCKAMEGLIKEGEETIDEKAEDVIKDLALIGAAQKVEHYEISGYGTARTLAELVGEAEIAELLQETLDEESETDELLTSVALKLNTEAASGAEDNS